MVLIRPKITLQTFDDKLPVANAHAFTVATARENIGKRAAQG